KLRIQEIPEVLSWVKHKAVYLIFYEDKVNYPFLILMIASTGIPSCIIMAMIAQLTLEIKHGMKMASHATKKYQIRAVFSLAMQGLVPSMFLIIPMITMFGIYLLALRFGLETSSGWHTASIISVMSINVMSMHAFLHSITVLACSPSYRKTIATVLQRLR
ncbi:hypothetical protein PENTCL1PPCAC_5002, partial [Pristionchus entomophagus]